MARSHIVLYNFLKGNGFGPWLCFFCGKDIPARAIGERRGLAIHHKDENRQNNRPSNLKPAHNGCHTGYHTARRWMGKKHTAESRRKMSVSHRHKTPAGIEAGLYT